MLCHFILSIYLVNSLASVSLHIEDYDHNFVGDPDVFIIGNQKGGTTSLSSLLTDQLGYFVESFGRKEPHFFDALFDDQFFTAYVAGFRNERQKRGTDVLTLDATPAFFRNDFAVYRVEKLYSPDCLRQKKFVLILREPVNRDFSWFVNLYGECKKRDSPLCPQPGGEQFHDTFHDYVERNYRKGTFVSDGFALHHLKRLLSVIPRDQVFIINFESLTDERQQETLNRLFYFLGVPPKYSADPLMPHSNHKETHCEEHCEDWHQHKVLCSDIRFLNEMYSNANKGLLDFINSGLNRPASEPIFGPYSESFPLACVEDENQ